MSARWTQEAALKLKYRSDLDPRGQGNHYIWEGGTGFGMRLYRTGRRTWVCGTTVTDKEAGKQIPRFFTVGLVGTMPLKDARIAADGHLNKMRSGVDPRPAEKVRQEAEGLATTTFEQAMKFYVENRNCAPISKAGLEETLRANASDWMQHKLLGGFTCLMLQKRYKAIMTRVRNEGEAYDRRWAKLPPEQRLLHPPAGYWTGQKAALDTVKGFTRVYRYWTRKHLDQLEGAGIVVPTCPTAGLVDDILPEPQRVKGIPIPGLCKIIDSFPTYTGNPLHPLLFKLLLASGRRIGVLMGIRKEWILEDRIVIPAGADHSKVPWRKRHLEYMNIVIAVTPIIRQILDEIEDAAPLYGDSEIWLFPSQTSESGHMEEERNMVDWLREHSGVYFTAHRLRHNFATAGEECGFEEGQIASLLGQGSKKVTARYIDERVKRHCAQMIEIWNKILELLDAERLRQRKRIVSDANQSLPNISHGAKSSSETLRRTTAFQVD